MAQILVATLGGKRTLRRPACAELGSKLSRWRRARQRPFIVGHLFFNAVEQRRAEISFTGVRKHAQDHGSCWRSVGDLARNGERRAARDAGQDALFLCQRGKRVQDEWINVCREFCD